jgi:hypothetical protein
MCIQLPSVDLIQLHSVAFLHFVDDAGNAFDLASRELPSSREYRACDARSSVMCDFVLLDFVMDYWQSLMVAVTVCR